MCLMLFPFDCSNFHRNNVFQSVCQLCLNAKLQVANDEGIKLENAKFLTTLLVMCVQEVNVMSSCTNQTVFCCFASPYVWTFSKVEFVHAYFHQMLIH